MSRSESSRVEPELAEICRESAEQLRHDGHGELAIQLLKAVLEAAGSDLPDAVAARLRATLAETVWRRGEIAEARELAAESLRLAQRARCDEAESEARFALGEVAYIEAAYTGKGSLDEALEHHERAVELRRRVGDRRGESLSLSRIGVIHERMDEHDRARACQEESLRIAEELDFPEGTFRPLVHLGVAKDRDGDLSGALENHRRSLAAAERAHHVDSLSFALCNVAEVSMRHDGNLESALDLLRRARECAVASDFRLALARIPLMTGEVLRHAGRQEDARRAYDEALRTAEAEGLPRFAQFARQALADLSDRADQGEELRDA